MRMVCWQTIMRMVCWQTILMKYFTLFFSKIEKLWKNLSSAAVVIGALRVENEQNGTLENGYF